MTLFSEFKTFCSFSPGATLQEACNELNEVCRTSEERFMDLGNELQQFAVTSRELSEHCTAVVDLLSSEKTRQIIQSKQEKLQLIKQQINGIKTDFDWIHEVLQHLLEHINEVRSPLEGMGQQITMLHNLGVSTRTCIAELGDRGKGFVDLADGLRDMAYNVQKQSTEILDQIGPLKTTAEQANKTLFHVKSGTFEQLANTTNEFIELTDGFLNQRAGFEKLSSELAHGFQTISCNVMEVVISLQFHDILRQSLEHCSQALEPISTDKKSPPLRHFLLPQNYKYIAENCRLQNRQITKTYADFHDAVSSAVSNLHQMTLTTRTMIEKAMPLAQIPTALASMSHTLEEKSDIINQYYESNAELTNYLDSVNATIESIFEAIGFMGSIENKMRLLGLNATIKAVHIGDGGEAVIVLSGAIQTCSAEISKNGQKVSKLLKQVVERFKMLAESRLDKKTMAQEMNSNFTAEADSIARLKQQVERSIEELNSKGNSLPEQLEHTAHKTTVHHDLEPNINKALSLLKTIEEQAFRLNQRFDRRAHEKDAIQHLRDLGSIYTVHTEREVHFKFLEELGVSQKELLKEKTVALDTADDETEVWSAPDSTAAIIAETESQSDGFDDLWDMPEPTIEPPSESMTTESENSGTQDKIWNMPNPEEISDTSTEDLFKSNKEIDEPQEEPELDDNIELF